MCGIAGVINHPDTGVRNVMDMVRAIHYRGPDEVGVRKVGRSVLGHARLAVVDPQNGTQPMSNTDGTVWVVFNGEIYNFVEIRQELKSKGYRFKSRCDTEVLVHLWREEGEQMLDKLIGMFAFLIWDESEDCGILARDRLGIKPCFYMNYDGGFAFCSEIKGLLELPHTEKRINPDALWRSFIFNYSPPPSTCFQGIYHLEPGTYLLFDGDREPVQKTYWRWPFSDERRRPDFEEFADLLDDSLRMQMRFDVKGGFYLSGGVDSSVVGAHLINHWNEPRLKAVCLDFSEPEYSEFSFAQKTADGLDIDLVPAPITPDMIPDIAEKVAYHAEQPHGDFSFFLFYILARQAHAEKKIVMFGGDGPDEVLLGFNHNVSFFQDHRGSNFPIGLYFDQITYMLPEHQKSLINADIRVNAADPIEHFEAVLAPWKDLDPKEQIIAYECTSLMPGNNLVKGDRMGACWSTEGRSPYLDHRVMEMFTRLPVEEKISNGTGKHYLKKYAENVFPEELFAGRKRMPTMPIGEWLKGSLYGWARDILQQGDDTIVNTGEALALLDEHKNGAKNHTRPLRTLLMTKVWQAAYGI